MLQVESSTRKESDDLSRMLGTRTSQETWLYLWHVVGLLTNGYAVLLLSSYNTSALIMYLLFSSTFLVLGSA